jgi:hypothetical protein
MRRVGSVLLLVSAVLQAQGAITIDDYAGGLRRMHSFVTAKQLDAAKAEAAHYAGKDIVSPRGNFRADDSLLHAIREARGPDPVLLARIALTIDELRAAGASGAPADPKLLQQVAAEQEVPELARGGEVGTVPIPETPLIKQIAKSIIDTFEWIGKKIGQLIDWIVDFFPRRSPERPGATSGMRWIVIAIVAVIVLAIIVLAIEVTRRARRGGANVIASTAPMRSTRDDDPLSRGATEWERYAAQLAGAGRYREAIRAWYHAVLVTCYAAGALHFRKGRTNWEYIASLPPSTLWRPELIRLTQRFEQEWYGSEQSSEDAFDDCRLHARRVLDELTTELRQRGAA